MEINVYSQYFAARGSFSGVERHGALVLLISDSEAGAIAPQGAVRASARRPCRSHFKTPSDTRQMGFLVKS